MNDAPVTLSRNFGLLQEKYPTMSRDTVAVPAPERDSVLSVLEFIVHELKWTLWLHSLYRGWAREVKAQSLNTQNCQDETELKRSCFKTRPRHDICKSQDVTETSK